MFAEITTLKITNTEFLILRYLECEGLVGESITQYGLYKFDAFRMDKPEPVSYEQAKEMYKNMTGKSNRIALWNMMKEINPEALDHRAECTRQDAISRVI